MRTGWSLKEAAQVLGISPNRVTQSLDPTLHRIALLWQADPTRTLIAILDAVSRLDITPDELDLLRRMKTGRLDHQEIGQPCPSACSGATRPCAASPPRHSAISNQLSATR